MLFLKTCDRESDHAVPAFVLFCLKRQFLEKLVEICKAAAFLRDHFCFGRRCLFGTGRQVFAAFCVISSKSGQIFLVTNQNVQPIADGPTLFLVKPFAFAVEAFPEAFLQVIRQVGNDVIPWTSANFFFGRVLVELKWVDAFFDILAVILTVNRRAVR